MMSNQKASISLFLKIQPDEIMRTNELQENFPHHYACPKSAVLCRGGFEQPWTNSRAGTCSPPGAMKMTTLKGHIGMHSLTSLSTALMMSKTLYNKPDYTTPDETGSGSVYFQTALAHASI